MSSDKSSGYTIFRLAEDYPQNGKPSYGLQPVFYYLSREQAKLGNDVHVISRRKAGAISFEQIEGVSVHRVNEPFSYNALQFIRREKGNYRNSIIHTHSTSGAILGFTRSILDVPMVSQVHGSSISRHMPVKLDLDGTNLTYSASKTWYYYFRERFLWSSADRIAAVSGAIKSDLFTCYRIPKERIDVVYNGVDTQLFRPLNDPILPDRVREAIGGMKVVLYVGHFGPRKGVGLLVRAMSRVLIKVPNAILVCIGGVPKWLGGDNSYWNQIQETIRREGLDGKILLLDRVSNDELPNYYAAANVFVLPSYYESFAKVVAEAMACMRPVVVTRGGGIDEVVEDGVSGIKVGYGSVESLAEAIVEILSDENLGRKMGERGRQKVEAEFTWDSVAQRVNQIYDRIFLK